ncbi:putative ATPase [Arthrobacter sp. CG_A4]|nr:putative ATPase [Arthrobacter sp. CG_A4]
MPVPNYPIRRLAEDPAHTLDRRRWPAVLPPVAQVLDRGLDLTPATVLVGEKGSGKSTLVEAIALAYGVSRRRVDRRAAHHQIHGIRTRRALAACPQRWCHPAGLLSQVVMSTHSPVLAALPGAQILEVGPWGLRSRLWADLDLVTHWRSFLDSPERYLRHI